MKKIALCFLPIIVTSCTFLDKRIPEKFKDVNVNQITGNIKTGSVKKGLNKEIAIEDFDLNFELFLPDIIETAYGIKLDNAPDALIGSIEKIRLSDNYIFLLDKYTTKSVKKFNIDGSFITNIGQKGNGPGEYIQPTDFYLGDSIIVIYDQFKSSLLFYDLDGNFIKNKNIPFFAVSFHIFDSNTYVFHTLDSDNYHLPDIINYSLVWTDSTFNVKHVNAFREKDRYWSFLSQNNMDLYNNKLYYHEPFNDTIFRVSASGDIYYDYIITFPGNELPRKLLLKENKKDFLKATDINSTNNYVVKTSNPIITKDFIFMPIVRNASKVSIIINSNRLLLDVGNYSSDQPISFMPPFSNILNSKDNTIIGYVNSYEISQHFEYMKRENRLHLLTEEFIDLAKNVNETDNAIIVFSKLKCNLP